MVTLIHGSHPSLAHSIPETIRWLPAILTHSIGSLLYTAPHPQPMPAVVLTRQCSCCLHAAVVGDPNRSSIKRGSVSLATIPDYNPSLRRSQGARLKQPAPLTVKREEAWACFIPLTFPILYTAQNLNPGMVLPQWVGPSTSINFI